MSNAWVQTVSGMDVDLLEPKPEKILLGDIAWSLARTARFNGHTITELPWSVAQHSLLVESLMPADSTPHDRLVALLHDGHEAYMGDLVSPLSIAIDLLFRQHDRQTDVQYGPDPSVWLKNIAQLLDNAIFTAFGLSPGPVCRLAVKTADVLALRVEHDLLMSPSRREWSVLPPAPDPMPHLRPPHPPERAMAVFLDRFHALQAMRHGISRDGLTRLETP